MSTLGTMSRLCVVGFLIWDCRPACLGQSKQDAIPELIRRLDDPNRDVSDRAADALIKLGEKAVPALIDEMKRPAEEKRGLWVTWVLGEIGSSSVVPLTRELENSNVHVRSSAIDGLMRIGTPAKTAVPAIARLLKDPNQYVRSDAAHALGELRDERAIENLMEVLIAERDHRVRQSAVTAIGKFGPKAKKAIPTLIEIVANPKVTEIDPGRGMFAEDSRWHAASTLAGMGSAAVGPLVDVLANAKHPRAARNTASWGLVQLGRHAASAVPKLIKVLDDADPEIREDAVRALRAIGPKASDALPAELFPKVVDEADSGGDFGNFDSIDKLYPL
jgi:HEAT repeat protein